MGFLMTGMFKFAACLGLTLGAVLAPALVGYGPATAQATPQTCALPPGATGPVGSFTSVSGNVLINGATGFVTAGIDTPVFSDSQITTGPGASSVISIGGACEISVGPDTTVTFAAEPGGIIVSQSVGSGLVGGGLGSLAAPFAIGASIAGLTEIVVGLGNDEPVSRR